MVFQSAAAESLPDRSAFSIQIENDLFGEGTDRNFTHGTRVSYVYPLNRAPKAAEKLRRLVPFLPEDADMRVGIALGQSIFTPDDITVSALIPDDRPYAGWLFGEVGLSLYQGDKRDNFIISLGVIGPASLAEEAQKFVHGIIGSPRPEGWANQLDNEPALLLIYERAWLLGRHDVANTGLEFDFSPRVGGALGNVFVYGAAGIMARIGPHLPRDYGAARIRPSLPGSAYFDYRPGKLDWHLFAGVEGRAVARNIFLDGNTFSESHSIGKRPLVFDLQLGAAMTLGWLRLPAKLSYVFVFRSKEFDGQKAADKFGSIAFSVLF